MDFLQLLSSYQENRSAFLKEGHVKRTECSLSPFFNDEETNSYLKQQRFNQYASNCTYAIENLGIRLGEKIDPHYLKELSTREQQIFLMRYEEKAGFLQIAAYLKLHVHDVQAIFKRTVRKLVKTLRDE
jgi:hypothetical protein